MTGHIPRRRARKAIARAYRPGLSASGNPFSLRTEQQFRSITVPLPPKPILMTADEAKARLKARLFGDER